MRTIRPKLGVFSKMFKIQLFCCFITQLVNMLQQWSLNDVMEGILPFVLNTKRPLSDNWLLSYKQTNFESFWIKLKLWFFSKTPKTVLFISHIYNPDWLSSEHSLNLESKFEPSVAIQLLCIHHICSLLIKLPPFFSLNATFFQIKVELLSEHLWSTLQPLIWAETSVLHNISSETLAVAQKWTEMIKVP